MFKYVIKSNGETVAGFNTRPMAEASLDMLCEHAEIGTTLELTEDDVPIIAYDANGNQII